MSAILRLQLHQFRNYAALDLAAAAPMIVLSGENGAGKTNLLEALSLLVPGRGLRRAVSEGMTRHGSATGFAISADIRGNEGDVRLGIGTERQPDGALARRIRIDGEAQNSSTAFSAHLRMLWLTPDQDGLFRGAAGDRRRFLDRLVLAIDPSHAGRASQFEKALRDRNRLLEDDRADPRWLAAIEREVAELGVAIAAGRVETVSRLAQLMARHDADQVFPQALITLDGVLEARIGTAPASEIEDWYRETLRANRMQDRAAGRTLIGPQASDLLVRHAAKNMPADLCSTGEQKVLLIGLILAQAALVADMTGIAPVLLLDEAVAHLDARRREALLSRLALLDGQVWMTGTDMALFSGHPADKLLVGVEAGAVHILEP
jgi:DNA replication and repair protein RecF